MQQLGGRSAKGGVIETRAAAQRYYRQYSKAGYNVRTY